MGFAASDPIYDPFYRLSLDNDIPVLVLVGYTGSGAGIPGGKGVKLDLCHPRYVDELAINYPTLKIITGRPAWPWQDEMIAVMLHKPNVWAELHGWSPKYLTEPLRRDIARRLKRSRDVRRRLSAVPLRTPGGRLEDAGLRRRNARARLPSQRREAVRAAAARRNSDDAADAALIVVDLALKDRVAVIGGSSAGIGFAIAELFASEGAAVTIVARRKEPLESCSRVAARQDRRARARGVCRYPARR